MKKNRSKKGLKILIISLSGMGDVLLFTPALHLLRENAPQANITFLVKFTAAAEVLVGNPDINEIMVYNPKAANIIENIIFYTKERKKRYDLSISTFPAITTLNNLSTWAIGAKDRWCYKPEMPGSLSFLQNHAIPYNHGFHRIYYNLKLVNEAIKGPPSYDSLMCRSRPEPVNKGFSSATGASDKTYKPFAYEAFCKPSGSKTFNSFGDKGLKGYDRDSAASSFLQRIEEYKKISLTGHKKNVSAAKVYEIHHLPTAYSSCNAVVSDKRTKPPGKNSAKAEPRLSGRSTYRSCKIFRLQEDALTPEPVVALDPSLGSINIKGIIPLYFISEDEKGVARDFLIEKERLLRHTETKNGAGDRGPAQPPCYIGIHPGSGSDQPFKRWEEEKFAALASELQRRPGARIILFGGPDELDIAKRIESMMQLPPIITAGGFNIRETAALINRCRLFISNDSGLMHLAVAVRTPVIGIFGPTDETNTYPVGEKDRVVILPCLSCKPECRKRFLFNKDCVYGFRCLRELKVEHVMDAILGLDFL